eukprot:2631266-Amphidinium_carterae.1
MRPGEIRILGDDDKLSALGKTGATALAAGSNRMASKVLRSNGRTFTKLMQRAGKLENTKAAYGYRPTYRQLGRLRAFIDHGVDFNPFADVIWGDSEPEMEEEQDVPPPAQSCPGRPDQATEAVAPGVEEPPELTPAELFNSSKLAAAAALALLQATAPPPKMEDSESSFHDPRDD